MSEEHTRGQITYFVGNANGKGLIRIEADHTSEDAGEHIASMPRGKKSEANAATMCTRWNSHAALVEALKLARDSLADGLETESCELEAEFSKSDRKLIAQIDAALTSAGAGI